MTRFIVVNPKARKVEAADFEHMPDAARAAGLPPGELDHGVAVPGLGFCVYEFGLFAPVAEQHYFGLGGRLFAGPAVFYGFDQYGETTDLRLSEFPEIRWYLGVNDVEASIAHEEIDRPIIAVNGAILWEWPQPAPEGFTR